MFRMNNFLSVKDKKIQQLTHKHKWREEKTTRKKWNRIKNQRFAIISKKKHLRKASIFRFNGFLFVIRWRRSDPAWARQYVIQK